MSDLPAYLAIGGLLLLAVTFTAGGFAAGWCGRGGVARDARARERRAEKQAAADKRLAHLVWDRSEPHLPPQVRSELAPHFTDRGRHALRREV